MVKSIGASSFQHILQQKSNVAEQEEREHSKLRVHSKKTSLYLFVRTHRAERDVFAFGDEDVSPALHSFGTDSFQLQSAFAAIDR